MFVKRQGCLLEQGCLLRLIWYKTQINSIIHLKLQRTKDEQEAYQEVGKKVGLIFIKDGPQVHGGNEG